MVQFVLPFQQKVRVFRREAAYHRQEERLRHDLTILCFQAVEPHALVSGVLVDEPQAVALFHQNIGLKSFSDKPPVPFVLSGGHRLFRRSFCCFCLRQTKGRLILLGTFFRPVGGARLFQRQGCASGGGRIAARRARRRGRAELLAELLATHAYEPGPAAAGSAAAGSPCVRPVRHRIQGRCRRLFLRGLRPGCGTGLLQSAKGSVVDRVVYGLLIGEFHFVFGGMNVHIHRCIAYRDIQYASWKPPGEQVVPVSLLQNGLKRTGPHAPPVHKEELAAAVALHMRGFRNIAFHGHGVALQVHGQQAVEKVAAEQAVYAGFRFSVAGRMELGGAVLDVFYAYVRGRKSGPDHSSRYGGAFGPIGLHEFQAGGGVIEKIAYDHRGAAGTAERFVGQDPAAFVDHASSLTVVAATGYEFHSGHGRDGGQRFATEAQGGDGFQTARVLQLAGRMAQKSGLHIVRQDAGSVVSHADIGHSSGTDLHGHVGGAGVHRIFHQFLDHAGGAFHHFAGSNQVGGVAIKLYDVRHRQFSCPLMRGSP